MSQTPAHAWEQLCMLKSREAEWGRTARRDGAFDGAEVCAARLCVQPQPPRFMSKVHTFSAEQCTSAGTHMPHAHIRQVNLPVTLHLRVDTLGIEPRASRMLSGCDTTTPHALDHMSSMSVSPSKSSAPRNGMSANPAHAWGGNMHFGNQEGRGGARPSGTDSG